MNTHTSIIVLSFIIAVILPAFAFKNAHGQPFIWNRDQLWKQLQQRFVETKAKDCVEQKTLIRSELDALAELAASIESRPLPPTDASWEAAENQMLALAPLLAACPDAFKQFVETVTRLQKAVKQQAATWPAETEATRRRLYRMIYGGRTATEEILLQLSSTDTAHEMWQGSHHSSGAPSTEVHGITIYSGDVLVTRGGAATSALIARGSDYPGNFSHVALVHVDEATGEASAIEALIESGVVITNTEAFFKDKKRRIMVLRLRPDLPAVVEDPLIAHKAAQWALDTARKSRIDYDFEMDFRSHTKLFCSEVIYAAYEQVGITLWSGLSHISAAGTRRWLEAFGVKNFTTLEPSDLEYDPQLARVVEWHNSDTLYEDHIHNAVTDVMLEGANSGNPIKYNQLMLPVAWCVKAYSVIKNSMGKTAPIPKGMGSAAALRNKWYTKQHARLVDKVVDAAEDFKKQNGYRPPYWELVRLARTAHGELKR